MSPWHAVIDAVNANGGADNGLIIGLIIVVAVASIIWMFIKDKLLSSGGKGLAIYIVIIAVVVLVAFVALSDASGNASSPDNTVTSITAQDDLEVNLMSEVLYGATYSATVQIYNPNSVAANDVVIYFELHENNKYGAIHDTLTCRVGKINAHETKTFPISMGTNGNLESVQSWIL